MTDIPEAVMARAARLKRFGLNAPPHPADKSCAKAEIAALRAAGYAVVPVEDIEQQAMQADVIYETSRRPDWQAGPYSRQDMLDDLRACGKSGELIRDALRMLAAAQEDQP